jgi:hypothetical protein
VWPNLRYYTITCPEELRKTTKYFARLSSLQAKISTQDVLNKKRSANHLTMKFGADNDYRIYYRKAFDGINI